MPTKIWKQIAMGSLNLLLLTEIGVAAASSEQSSPDYPPKGCKIIQKDGVMAGAGKPQKFHVALGRCGKVWTAWLFLKQLGVEPGNVVILDILQLPILKESESVNLAGGVCLIGKKPILENIILLAKWNNHKYIKAGTGIVHVWLPNVQRKRFVKTPITDMICYRDQP